MSELVNVIEAEHRASVQLRAELAAGIAKLDRRVEVLERMLDAAREISDDGGGTVPELLDRPAAEVEAPPALAAVPAPAEPDPGPVPAAPQEALPPSSGERVADAAPAPVGRDGLSATGSKVLSALRVMGGGSAAEIASRCGISAPTATRQLRGLAERGLAEHNGLKKSASRWSPVGTHDELRDAGAGGGAVRAARPVSMSGLDGSVRQRVELALRYAKVPLKAGAIASKAHATLSRDRQQVVDALAELEAAGEARELEGERWELTASGRERLAA